MPMNVIDVLVAIDAKSIVQSLGHNDSASNPSIVDNTHVAITGTGQSAKDNNLSFHFADLIFWRGSAIGRGYACAIYDFFYTGDVITRPQLESFPGITLTPNPESPNAPTVNHVKLWNWKSNAATTGQMSCGIRFVVFDAEGQKMGYYQYNGSITVS